MLIFKKAARLHLHMEPGMDLEQIAKDPLAIFDWFTDMVQNHVLMDPNLADRYQTMVNIKSKLRSVLETAPSIQIQYEVVRDFMNMGTPDYGGVVQTRAQLMLDTMAKYIR